MASELSFVEYVCEQIGGAGNVSYRKMFGEYTVYCGGKVVGMVCDNQFFVKITKAGAAVNPGCEEVPPYEGAKPYFLVENVDDRELMARFISATWGELPLPKPKKKNV